MSDLARFGVWAAVIASSAFALAPMTAGAASIRGRVKPPGLVTTSKTLGYTKTRIAGPSNALRSQKDDVALYLKVKKSLPLSAPNEKRRVQIRGMSFLPRTIACVFDEAVVFTNLDRTPVTLSVGDTQLGAVQPNQEAVYKCEVGGNQELRLKEWPHVRGTVFVGEVGVATRPDADGRFSMNAPEGTYELQVIASNGVIHKTDVVVEKADVDLGLVGAEQPLAPAAAAPSEPAAAKPPPPAPPKVVRTPPPPRPPARRAAPPKPKPPAAPPPAAEKPPPAPAPAAQPKPKPKPKPESKPAPADDFFEMEE